MHQVAPIDADTGRAGIGVGMCHPSDADSRVPLRQVRGPSVATLCLCTGLCRDPRRGLERVVTPRFPLSAVYG